MSDVVIVGRRGNDDVICVCVRCGGVRCRMQGGGATYQIGFDEGIFNGGDAVVNVGNSVLIDVDGNNVVMLGKQTGKRKAYIAKACNGDIHRCLPAKLTYSGIR